MVAEIHCSKGTVQNKRDILKQEKPPMQRAKGHFVNSMVHFSFLFLQIYQETR